MARTTRRWAIRRADGFFATGKPWEVDWSVDQDEAMVFERAIHARYLIDKVLGLPGATVVLL